MSDPPPAVLHLATSLREMLHEHNITLPYTPMCSVRAYVLLESLGFDVGTYPTQAELAARDAYCLSLDRGNKNGGDHC